MNAAIRYIHGIRKREHITPCKSSLQWLTTNGRRNYFTAALLYRIFFSDKPSYIPSRYIVNDSNPPVMGYKQALCIPAFQKEFLKNSFYVTYLKIQEFFLCYIFTACKNNRAFIKK